MNIRTTFIILLTLVYFESFSQSIFSALRHDDAIDLRTDSKVKEITKTTIFYNKSGTETKKDIIVVNQQNKITSELRYGENGKLETRLSRTFDSTGIRSLQRKIERWHPVIGYTSEIATYEYDENGFMIKITDRNQNNQIIRETFLKNNEKGHPIELKLNTGNSNSYGIEVAEYDYSNNMAFTKVLDDNGKTLSESKHKIDFSIKDLDNSEYDENGNLIKSKNYEYEYKYDKKLNWKKKTIYKIENGKRKKHQVLTRKIKYE
jgi:YD repeat-containing protein